MDEPKSRQELEMMLAMIEGLEGNPGWKWISALAADAKAGWENALRTHLPVGEGAAKLAQAQGALLALQQFLTAPANTKAALVAAIKELDIATPSSTM